MAEVWKASEVFTLDHDLFEAAGMKAVPVAREFAAFGIEFGPAFLVIEGILFFLVGAGVVVDDHVGVEADVVFVGLLDKRFEFGAIAVEGFDAALLVVVAEVPVVIGAVTHGAVIEALRNGRKP